MSSTKLQQEGSVLFKTGTFAFSGASINDLESSEYTLVAIAADTSYSIHGFVNELKKALQDVIRSCQDSPRSDNLMVRVVNFDRTVNEFHGFKELNKCNVNDYDNLFATLGGSTALYDGCVDVIQSVNKYGQELADNDYSVNAIVVVLTDGDDNNSTFTTKTVKQKLQEALGEKKLESLVSILVGVNTADAGIGILLKNFASEAGFTQFINIEQANAKSLAKLAQFISKSISSQSSSLGTGGASAQLTF